MIARICSATASVLASEPASALHHALAQCNYVMYLAPVLECQLLLHPNGSFVHLVTKALCSEPRGGHDMSGRFTVFTVV